MPIAEERLKLLGKFDRKRKKKHNGAVCALIVLTAALIAVICFAFKLEGMQTTTDNGAQLQTTEVSADPVSERTEECWMPVIPEQTIATTEPVPTEEETIATEAPMQTPTPTEIPDPTEETEQGNPLHQELQLIETKPAAEQTLEIMTFDEDEVYILMHIAMAEVGCEECVECAALVMRTVLNRVESPKFPNTLQKVIYAEEQFTPVWRTGSFYTVNPNDVCVEALELIRSGWDESEGALYYEACTDGSWHSRNLELLYQHCNTRFYK